MQEKQIPIYLIHPHVGEAEERAMNMKKITGIIQNIQEALPQVLVVSSALLAKDYDNNTEQALAECKSLMEIVYLLAGGEAWAFGDFSSDEWCKQEMHHVHALGMTLRIDPNPWLLETKDCYDHNWTRIGDTTPSGKVLFRCAKCGISDPAPVRAKYEIRLCRPIIKQRNKVASGRGRDSEWAQLKKGGLVCQKVGQ